MQLNKLVLFISYETWTLLGLDVSQCRTCVVSPTNIIALTYVIFSNYERCPHVSVHAS